MQTIRSRTAMNNSESAPSGPITRPANDPEMSGFKNCFPGSFPTKSPKVSKLGISDALIYILAALDHRVFEGIEGV